MSDSRYKSLSFNQLPLEVLHGILRYLDIPDILRIRRVSRYLNGVGHSREVWSDAYRKAEFVRPPGPFLSQSVHDLENTLVSGFRVDRNLRNGAGTAQKQIPTRKVREIWYTGVDIHVSLLFGRFLIIALCEEVRCYDLNLDALDSNSGASILYRTTDGFLQSFHCVSAIDIEGRPFACAVLSEVTQATRQISIYSLNVGEQSEVTLDLLHQFEHNTFEVDIVKLGPRVVVIQGRVGPDLGADWRLVALDVYSCTEFLLSSFTQTSWEAALAEIPEWRAIDEMTIPTSVSTSTHLLLANSFYTLAAGWCTFLQAYMLPPLHARRHLTPISTPLNLSHRGIIPGIDVRDTVLLHDAVLDSTTQDVLIAIRVNAFELSRPRAPLTKHGILRLSAPPTSHGHDHEVGTVAFQLLGSLGQSPQLPILHPSFNGTGRVFYTLGPGPYRSVSALEYDLRTGGGNDTEGYEAKVIEYPFTLQFPALAPRTLLDYDPYSGRICLRSPLARHRMIEILDLAV